MKLYDVFASEGGYRVCLNLWGDDPVIAHCPWYARKCDASRRANRERKLNEESESRMEGGAE